MNKAELLTACGWSSDELSTDFDPVEKLAGDAERLIVEDPFFKNTREPVPEEREELIRILERIFERVSGKLVYAPDDFLVADGGLFDGFALGSKAIISANLFQQEEDLQATIAYLIGSFNNKIPYSDYVVAVRYAAVPFHYVDELPGGYRADILHYSTDIVKRYQHRDKSVPKGHPIDLRPKPPGVLLASGNNYSNFVHTEREEESEKTAFDQTNLIDVDSAQGVQAVTEYLDLFPDDMTGRLMKGYFRNRHKWAEFFKHAQAEADRFACIVLGQGEQIARFLERYKNIYAGEGINSTHFGRSLSVRIAALRDDPNLLVYKPTAHKAPPDWIAMAEAQQERQRKAAIQAETERKARLAEEERARKLAEREAPDLAFMEKSGISYMEVKTYPDEWSPKGYFETSKIVEFASLESFLRFHAGRFKDRGFKPPPGLYVSPVLGKSWIIVYSTGANMEFWYLTNEPIAYKSEHNIKLSYKLLSCAFASNGPVVRQYFSNQDKLPAALEGLRSDTFYEWWKTGKVRKYEEPDPIPYQNPLLRRTK